MALAAALFDCVLLSARDGIPQFVTSDTLLPMHMAWDTHGYPAAWSLYQWPRIPSLIPDMAYFHGAERLGLGWRGALLGFIPVMLGLLALGMGAIIGRFHRRSLLSGAAQAALAIAALLLLLTGLVAATGLGPWSALLLILLPVTHGSGFILSLFAAATADAALHGDRRAFWATILMCLVGAFSDLLFVIAFLIPLAAASRVAVIRPIIERGGLRGLLTVTTCRRLFTQNSALVYSALAACLIGWASQRMLNLQPLGTYLLKSPGAALPQMLGDFRYTPWTGLVIFGSAALIVTAIASLRQNPAAEASSHHSASFLIAFGAVAAIMGFGLLAVTYVDPDSWRYGMTSIWWPLIIGLALRPAIFWTRPRSAPRSSPQSSLTYGFGGALLLAATVLVMLRPPPLLAWHSALETCLTRERARLGLRHGLAPYWLARTTEASSNWKLQVRPIADDGSSLPWGDDATLMARDANVPGAPAWFNFIVVDNSTQRAEIIQRFGVPAARKACAGAELWTYDHRLLPT